MSFAPTASEHPAVPLSRVAIGLAACAVVLEALYAQMAWLVDLRQHALPFLGYFGAAFCAYMGMVWLVSQASDQSPQWSPTGKPVATSRPPTRAGTTNGPHGQARGPMAGSTRGLLIGLIVSAVAFRLTLIAAPPRLSDDIYRYVWDGRVQQAGINPYRYAPSDAALAALRDDGWRSINHPDIPTIYPPLMQLAFRLGTQLAPTLTAQKLVFVLCDLAVVLLLPWLLPMFGVSPLMSVIYAWHPLVIVEIAGSGHNDPLGVVWLLIGLALWHHQRRRSGTVAFALCFLSKLTTALLVPFYARRERRLLILFVALILAGYLPFAGTPHLFVGHGHYTTYWEFNSSLFMMLYLLLRNPLCIRALTGVALVAVGWRLAKDSDLLRYTTRMIQLSILLTPVLEPWYLIWLIALLCFRPSWMWLVFSGLVTLSYMVLVRYVSVGVWRIPAWVPWVEYGPLYVWLFSRAYFKIRCAANRLRCAA